MKFLEQFPTINSVVDSALAACAHGARTRRCKTEVQITFTFTPDFFDAGMGEESGTLICDARLTSTIGSVYADSEVMHQDFCNLPVKNRTEEDRDA